MNYIIFNYKFFFILLFFLNLYENQKIELLPDKSDYYEEKYFRILSNNYDTIDPGTEWKEFDEGYGFVAKKDFGSLILLKDWSMYNFKLTKVLFVKSSSFNYGNEVDAEMWLIHTKDNGYYPPGRRIYLKQNYFIIVVPFVKTDNNNPAADSLLEFLNFKEFRENSGQNSPKKPVKLYQIIQNQPSYLFEGNYKNIDALFMVFTQYHYITKDYLTYLKEKKENQFDLETNNVTNAVNDTLRLRLLDDDECEICLDETNKKIYRNTKYENDIKPKATLMAYSNANYLKNVLFFLIIFIFLL
jgi:hypothetical protein